MVLAVLVVTIVSFSLSTCRGQPLFEAVYGTSTGSSCTTSLDCGTNIEYEVCSRTSKNKTVECTGSSSESGCKCTRCHSDSLCDINKQNDVCVDDHWCEMKPLMHSFQTETVLTIIAILYVPILPIPSLYMVPYPISDIFCQTAFENTVSVLSLQREVVSVEAVYSFQCISYCFDSMLNQRQPCHKRPFLVDRWSICI